MFGLKSLFATSKPIQYASYVIVLTLIVVSKFYSDPKTNSAADIKQSHAPIVEIPPSFTTTIDRVIDGDTFIAGGHRYRLAFIDAPEKNQAYGQEATDFLHGLVTDTTVTLTHRGQDHYGRLIADASIDGISIAELMIENGFAWSYRVPTDEQENKLDRLQEKAKAWGVGLWADTEPVRPSIYRALQHAANNE